MLKIGNIDISLLYIGNTPIIKAYVGSKLVYEKSDDYYGISFTTELEDSTRTRIGKEEYHRTLPLQSKMKGCTLTSEGVVKYLKSDDWTKYEDDTDRDYSLNTMVEIPEFWLLTVVNDNVIELRLYQKAVSGAEHFPKSYCSAYEIYNDNNVAKSINNGSNPSVSFNRTTCQQYARANGNDHWNAYTYKIHKALSVLYLVEYANTNCQLAVNTELTPEGYRQGGLGPGATTGSVTINGSAKYSIFECGCTDSIGNGSGEISREFTNTDAEGAETGKVTRKANRYRGVENPFGHLWKNVVDVVYKFDEASNSNQVYYTEDRTNFNDTGEGYYLKASTVTTSAYYKDFLYTPNFELFVPVGTGITSNSIGFWCDYTYTNNSKTDRTLLIGGGSGDGGRAGLFNLNSSDAVGASYVTVGSRLVYID